MNDTCRHLVTALVVLAAFAPALRAEVVNGGFEDALPLEQSWNVRDWVQVEPTGLGHVAFFEEPGTGGVSELWQAVQIPSTASMLTFRYRFASPPDSVAPQLLAAYSRKVHGSTNPVTLDLDVLAGETECRSETIDLDTTDLTIVAKFDRRVALLGLPGARS